MARLELLVRVASAGKALDAGGNIFVLLIIIIFIIVMVRACALSLCGVYAGVRLGVGRWCVCTC